MLSLTYSHASGTATILCTACTVPTDQWSFVAATLDQSGSVMFYINGLALSMFPGPTPNDFTNTQDLRLGASVHPTPAHFDGILDEVELFDEAVPLADLDDIHDAREWGKCKPGCRNPAVEVLTAGLDDDFGPAPDPPSTPRPNLLLRMQSCSLGSTTTFDDTIVNRCFGHTFQSLPSTIVAATLRIPLRAMSVPLVQNDRVALQLDDNTNAFDWSRSIEDLSGTGTWNPGDEQVFALDLAALPLQGGGTIDLLPALKADGHLDIFVQDDTRVDDIELTLVVCEGLC